MKPKLYLLDAFTEHPAHFLFNVFRILSEWYDICGSYCDITCEDDLEKIRPYRFTRFDEHGFCGGAVEEDLGRVRPALVICWNKHYHFYRSPLRYLRERMPGCPVVFAEAGWFPQREYVYLDPDGINADSSIAAMTADDLRRTPLERGRLDEFRAAYRGGREIVRGDFVLCPLQVPGDMNIVRFSPWREMQDFMRHVAAALPGERILFKCHPLDPRKGDYFRLQDEIEGIRVSDSADLKWCLAHCDQVVGINSTVLLEALLFGKKVTYLGAGIGSNKPGVFNYDLADIGRFEPDADLRDRFLCELIFNRQISVRAPERERVLRFVPVPPPAGGGSAGGGETRGGCPVPPTVGIIEECACRRRGAEEDAASRARLAAAEHELRAIRASKAWRLGCAFQDARRSLRGLLLLPLRAFAAVWGRVR